jgi:histidinol-phosphate/aromatic aminotransferase/cobyric acid decarboxylase-like protein
LEPKGFVVIDQAYAEFGGDDLRRCSRTTPADHPPDLSKAMAMAGLRVGYLLGAPEVVANHKAKLPYNLNSFHGRR